jgi:xanthine/CO dehydrogenase XdhC/CoxF family maturation factor
MHILLLRVGLTEHWQPLAHFAEAFAAHTATAVGRVTDSHSTRIALGARVLPGDGTTDTLTAATRTALEASSRSGHPGWFEQSGHCRLFLLPLALPPRVLLLGVEPDASPVARLATQPHWKVTVVDHHRPTLTQTAHFPAAERVIQARPETLLASVEMSGFQAAVVMTHQLEMGAGIPARPAADRATL